MSLHGPPLINPIEYERATDQEAINRAILAEYQATPKGRRAIALRNPEFFDTQYCGMIAAPHRTNWLNVMDQARLTAQQRGRKAGVLLLAPRNHGKSEAGITYIVREICRNRNIRILLVAETLKQAVKRMSRIKALLSSKMIQMDWCGDPESGNGPFNTGDQKWTESQITVARTIDYIDPTLEAVGSGGAITGGHFDRIVFDDVESPESVTTANKRRETRDWLTGTIWPTLNPGGLLIAIGTHKHADDLYAHLKKNIFFKHIEDPAIFKYLPTGERVAYVPQYEIVTKVVNGVEEIQGYKVDDPDVRVLWQDETLPVDLLRDLNFLLSELISMGPAQFHREYQHKVIDDDSAMVKQEWLIRACNRGRSLTLYSAPVCVDKDGEQLDMPMDMIIVQSVDLSLVTDRRKAEEMNRDFTVIETWGLDRRTKDRYLMGLNRFRGVGPEETVQRIINEYRYFDELGLRPSQVRVEKNNFGELIYGQLAGSGLPLTAHITSGANKNDAVTGVAGLRSILDTNRVVLPQGDLRSKEMVNHLVEEIYMLGKAAHDDTVMAWWIAEFALRVNTTGQAVYGAQPVIDMAAKTSPFDRTVYDWSNYTGRTGPKRRSLFRKA